ncbi:MAG: AAA family ATPase [Methanomassiliicoccales archaeon]|nr:MAG: AAA family ATPase [Methanomassiliicoccales archaeon]
MSSKLKRHGRVFKDQSKLSFDYVPERLVHREKQLEILSSIFRPVLEGQMSQTAMLVGSVGTGKTATTKRFCLDAQRASEGSGRAIDFIIVNCRQRSSENAVLQRLIAHFDDRYPDRGFSTAEMLRAIAKHIEKRKIHLIVVLDEADVLVRRGASDLIYQLSRFDEEKICPRPSLSLILISQKYVLDMLDQAAVSTFRRANAIRFERYSSQELKDIVSSRAELALFPGSIDDGPVQLIADIASEFGDARFAIELLEKAGMIAEEGGHDSILAEHVRAAKALTYSVVTESKIEDLDRQRKLVLLAICRSMKDQAYVTTGEVERAYKVVAEEHGEKARAHTQFWEYVQDLSNNGLISTKVTGDPSGGRTTYISLPDIPAKVLAEKLESVLRP